MKTSLVNSLGWGTCVVLLTFSLRSHAAPAPTSGTNLLQFRISQILDDASLAQNTPSEHDYYTARRVAEFTIPEALPAPLDPDGHWGKPADDLQLSLRFRRREFLTNEPVPAIAVFRNLNVHPQELFLTNGPGFFHGVSITVSSATAQILSILPEEIQRFERRTNVVMNEWEANLPLPFAGLEPFRLEPSTEILFARDLCKLFDLCRPGTYTASAVIPVWLKRHGLPTNCVFSAPVSFRIVEKPSPEGVQERKVWEQEMKVLGERFQEMRFREVSPKGVNGS